MSDPDLGVVLVRTHLSANLGSVARAAKNFGVSDLRLVEPAAPADAEAIRLASGADDVLAASRRFGSLSEAIADFDAVVATSSLRGRQERRCLRMTELPGFLAAMGAGGRVGFVFGPERSGLTEEERSRASLSLRLPVGEAFPTLNLSHAVAVVLAAARLEAEPLHAIPDEDWAATLEVEQTIEHWDRALEAIGFYDTGHRERSLRDWKRIVAGRPMTRKEVAMLRGVANRVLVSLRRAAESGRGRR